MDTTIARTQAADTAQTQVVKKSKTLSAKQKLARKQWDNGKIEILVNSTCHLAGDVIRGQLVIYQKCDFPGSEVRVGINGSEMVYFRRVNAEADNYYHGKYVITNASYVVH